MQQVDVLILGAGAAGLFCGARAAQRGRTVRVLDHARKPAEKVRISGGGRCNFTNLETEPKRFLSRNPHFAKSALARYTPWDFCSLMAEHGLTWHEKTLGQLFCDQKSGAVIEMLLNELETAGGTLSLSTEIDSVVTDSPGFITRTSEGSIRATSLVIATGGLSIPKMGATAFAYDMADQFGHDIVTPRPALVPMTFTDDHHEAFSALSGVSLPVEARTETGPSFVENLLFTHRGLSGPSILQISSYWQQGDAIRINLIPGMAALDWLKTAKSETPKRPLGPGLTDLFPARVVDYFCTRLGGADTTRLAELSNRRLDEIAQSLNSWSLKPAGTEGWRTAEVTAGGVATDALSSRTMESQIQPGLFIIGECVDVSGWLGGYNIQRAWESAEAAAEVG